MMEDNKRVCPVENSGFLDNWFRKVLQNPAKLLQSYIKEGMTVIDLGCGPGFLTIPLAKYAGEKGKVIAVDLQDGMLKKVENKIKGTALEQRVILHKCQSDRTGIETKADLVIAFYMLHEHPDQKALFKEMFSLLNEQGKMLVVEPVYHVSKKDFENTLNSAIEAGFVISEQSKSFMDRKALLLKPA
ncbi:MAG: class I SAM-dependent methyltransferase [Elusimicrobia bacterium]|nr:class I SAM-dependent methyltransferase [Candidatus Liberimonas magnetica]